MNEHAALETSLGTFLTDAVLFRDNLRREGSVVRLLPSPESFAKNLAGLPSAKAADGAAAEAALANSYMSPTGETTSMQAPLARRAAGRTLSARALLETGVAGLVLSGEPLPKNLGAELAGYLAGPHVSLWDYAILDADVTLSQPVPVVDRWELLTPTTQELVDLVGLPSAARHVPPRLAFNIDLYANLAMLRRVDPDGQATQGIVLYFRQRPSHALWRPLLALSLYQNPVLHLWAQYDVEPGRRVDVLFDHVYTEPDIVVTPEGDEIEIERVRQGRYKVNAGNETRFRAFLHDLAPLIERAADQPGPERKETKSSARLRRIAEHFLTASEDAHGEGEVLSELKADAVLHYVIALEAVLAGDEGNKSELTRKVVQRAAVLAGANDGKRVVIAKTVQAAYGARSDYAHGGEPQDIPLPALRQIVRDCILARLIIGDPTPEGETLAKVADDALLDHAFLEHRVRAPIDAFWRASGSPS